MLKNDENIVIEDVKKVKKSRKSSKKVADSAVNVKDTVTAVATEDGKKTEDNKKADGEKVTTPKKRRASKKVEENVTADTTDSKTDTAEDKTNSDKKEKVKKPRAKKADKAKKSNGTEEAKTMDDTVSAVENVKTESTGDVKKNFKGKTEDHKCDCDGSCTECSCDKNASEEVTGDKTGDSTVPKKEKRYGNISLTCRADVLAKIVGCSVAQLVPKFNLNGVKLKFITDFNPAFYADDADDSADSEEGDRQDRDEAVVENNAVAEFEDFVLKHPYMCLAEIMELFDDKVDIQRCDNALEAKLGRPIRFGRYTPEDFDDLMRFLAEVAPLYTVEEISEMLELPPSIVKEFCQEALRILNKGKHGDERVRQAKAPDISMLNKNSIWLSNTVVEILDDIAIRLYCSYSKANEYAKQNNIKVSYTSDMKLKKATTKDLSDFLERLYSENIRRVCREAPLEYQWQDCYITE